jgi:ArsR family transcriptional regulator, lead/cadmium/zinc/bismuth-responsive transcriptional repressor
MVKSNSVASKRTSSPGGLEKPECRHDGASGQTRSVGPLALARAAALFRACGDPERLRLLERLSQGEFCVSELAASSGEGLSTVSQRLRLLRAEGLVSRRREGKHIFYGLFDQHVADLIHTALEHALEPRAHEHQDTGDQE